MIFWSRKVVYLGAYWREMTVSWWRHQMETLSALLWPLWGESVDFPLKGQWRGALMISLICAWPTDWANNPDAGDLRRHRAQYDVTVIGNCKFMVPQQQGKYGCWCKCSLSQMNDSFKKNGNKWTGEHAMYGFHCVNCFVVYFNVRYQHTHLQQLWTSKQKSLYDNTS